MNRKKINIWPLRPIYVIFVLGITGIFLLFLSVLPFWVLTINEPFKLFDLIPLNYGWQKFLFAFIVAIVLDFLYIKSILFKITFTCTSIIIPKLLEIHEKREEIQCNQIVECDLAFQNVYYYFIFQCLDGKTRKIFITRFSNKQLKRILEMIKERGGLQDQSIDLVIDLLYYKRFKKNTKKKIF